MTFAEYVERELRSDVKSEWHGGEVLAMSGGTINHSRIIRNVACRLAERLEGKPCESFESNLRLYVQAVDRGFYPDAQIICGPVEYYASDKHETTVLNPTVVIEVLSESTATYDRGEKMNAYLTVPSLQQYVLIDSTSACVEVFTRREDGWLRTYAAGVDGALKLESIGLELQLAELYAGVNLTRSLPAS
jgi:Uma2 family endonuclease